LFVGAALFIFTVVTVGLSYVRFEDARIFRWAFQKIGIHGHGINITIGLIVATFKVALVGAWFMHLKSEKGTIWRPLLFTFFFCLGLFLLSLLAHSDPIPTTSHPLH
jgi:caa(3)-type oxidase subunit IV